MRSRWAWAGIRKAREFHYRTAALLLRASTSSVWHRPDPRESGSERLSDSVLGSSAMMSDPYWAASTTCRACGGQSLAGSYLCARCRPIMARVETRKDPQGRGRAVNKQARLRAMEQQFDPSIDGYRCYFTGVPLELAAGTRRSAEWAHLTAGDESSVVLACKLVNRMQTDLTESEFAALVKALARRFEGEPFDESAFPPDR